MRWLSRYAFAGIALIVGLIGGSAFYATSRGSDGNAPEQSVPVLAKPLEVKLTRTYQCGVKDEQQERWTGGTLDQLLARFAGWEIVAADGTSVTLHKWENDIAPVCKENGYIGLSPDGRLSLFNGPPEKGNVIQAFYPLNLARMKASLPREEVDLLQKGIRVRDVAEYNSVLSTYGEFQAESEEGAAEAR